MKYTYNFGGKEASGNAEMKALLGGKGANLAEMTNIGIPVPPGFTISTEVCAYFYNNNRKYPAELEDEINSSLKRIEELMNKKYGASINPLLVSVRSGARASMPGMMDTVLNIGLNDDTVKGLIKVTGNERFAYDCYRRFVQMFGDVVLGLKPKGKDEIDPFEEVIERKKKVREARNDLELTANDLRELVLEFKELIKTKLNVDFPQDPQRQLLLAISAVFESWNNERAITYRKINKIPDDWGTAVNVQAMVFGNMGQNCGTGVAFSRNPATGENVLYGEYLMNAQGEDVVAGIRTPLPISSLGKDDPKNYEKLLEIAKKLEIHYREMQDVEFTIEGGNLWMLQTRTGKRTGIAALKIACDMVTEGLTTKERAILSIDPMQLNQLLRPVFDTKEKEGSIKNGNLLTTGLNAGPGAAWGRVVFNAQDAERAKEKSENVILVRIETSPEDIKGMAAAAGILTERGGMTSHAALVARQMGTVCIVGASELNISYEKREFSVRGITVREGEIISIDGGTGEVILGKVQTKPSEVLEVLVENRVKPENSPMYQIFNKLMTYSDEFRKLKIRTNADQPDQAKTAVAFGAEGIGLCRTEHMFFGGDKIRAMREMILAEDTEGRKRALKKLLPMQREDFVGIFKEMEWRPVTVRLLDPPLHEFLPQKEEDILELAKEMKVSPERLKEKISELHEFNPMLGHRGCRLGITYPEIYEMQVEAIMEAACELTGKGHEVNVEIMIPIVGFLEELSNMRKLVEGTCARIMNQHNHKIKYTVGTMIELPRACVTADKIAEVTDFFSFGTNDLTQTTLGVSRDDSGVFLNKYIDKKIIKYDPFATIDFEGVGELMKIAVEKGRATNKNLKIGICGEHGGDPDSIYFCHKIGLNYVSCSPFRVPIARLAAAQANLKKD